MDFLRHLLVYIIALGCSLAFAQESRFNEGLQRFTQQKYKEAFDIFHDLVRAQPQNAVYRYNLCQAYYKLGNFPYALSCYNGVINSTSKLREPALFYKSITLINLEREEEALGILRSLFNETKNPSMKRLVRFTFTAVTEGTDVFIERAFKAYNENNFKETIHQTNQSVFSDTGSGNLLKAMAQFALGDNDNAKRNLELVLLYSKDPSVLQSAQEMKNDPPPPQVSGGSEITFSSQGSVALSTDDNVYQVSSASESDTAMSVQATGGLEVHISAKQNFGATITGRLIKFNTHSELDEQEVTMELYTHRTGKYVRNYFGFYSSRLAFDNSDSLAKTGLNYTFEKTMAENLKFGFIGDTAWQDSMDASFNYLRGSLYKLKVYSNFIFAKGEISPYFQYNQQNTGVQEFAYGTLPSAFKSTSLGLILLYNLDSTSFAQFNSSITTKNFSPASQPSDIQRSDSQSALYLRYQRQLKKEIHTFVEYCKISTHSSLDDDSTFNKSFEQSTLLAGLAFSL